MSVMPTRTRLPTKQLLSDVVSGVSPDFSLLPNQRDYWFRRGPNDLAFNFIVIQSSQKHPCYSVDLVASVFPTWDRQYGGHLLRRATGLPNVRANSSMIPMEDTIYAHDGTEDGARRTLQRIRSELVQYALPWFKEFKDSIANDSLVQYGFQWLHQNQTRIAKPDQEDFSSTLATHPLLDELKQLLREFAWDSNLPKRHRQETGILAYDLIHFATLDTHHGNDG
jgi:hypothetical protein